MYVDELADGSVQVQYIENAKQEVSVKLSMGIHPERILEGK